LFGKVIGGRFVVVGKLLTKSYFLCCEFYHSQVQVPVVTTEVIQAKVEAAEAVDAVFGNSIRHGSISKDVTRRWFRVDLVADVVEGILADI